jgi:purine-binding chemotaxis protein CheW
MISPPNPVAAKDVLRQRAHALAAPPPVEVPGATLHLIEFALADERYALELDLVSAVHPLDRLTPLPCTPAFLTGVINIRGRIVAVIDLKRFFELPEKGISDVHRVVVVQQRDVELGLLADYVVGTRRVAVAALQPALPTLTGIRAEYLKGITAERLIVLDATRLLGDPKLVVDETPRA